MFQCKQLLRLEVQIVDFLATEYLTLNEKMRGGSHSIRTRMFPTIPG